jgi:hypothetical protein
MSGMPAISGAGFVIIWQMILKQVSRFSTSALQNAKA